MATALHSLSEYDPDQVPNGAEYKIGICTSEWNNEITFNLLKGALDSLLKHGVKEDNIIQRLVPGSFELPIAADLMLEKKDLDAVICLGCVIRGETAHFDYVCQATALGIKDVSIKHSRPVIFGVLTDDHIEQSRARSGGKHGNKGVEAAISALKMVAFERKLSKD